jgi:hypothetical protein
MATMLLEDDQLTEVVMVVVVVVAVVAVVVPVDRVMTATQTAAWISQATAAMTMGSMTTTTAARDPSVR